MENPAESGELPGEAGSADGGGDDPTPISHYKKRGRVDPTAEAVAALVGAGLRDTHQIAKKLKADPAAVHEIRLSERYRSILAATAETQTAEIKVFASKIALDMVQAAAKKLADGEHVSSAEVNFISKLLATIKPGAAIPDDDSDLSPEAQTFMKSLKG